MHASSAKLYSFSFYLLPSSLYFPPSTKKRRSRPQLTPGPPPPFQPGGQDSQLVAQDLSTHIDSKYLLQTHDHPPAYIAVMNDGWRVGPRDILEKLENPAEADEVDPKLYSFRVNIRMETGDARYLHLNTGMWVGSGIRRGTEG